MKEEEEEENERTKAKRRKMRKQRTEEEGGRICDDGFFVCFLSLSGPQNVQNASTVIQSIFESHFRDHFLSYNLTEFNGRSDYGPFIAVGIPAGGLATGKSYQRCRKRQRKKCEEWNMFE
jgi:hypothetical protein